MQKIRDWLKKWLGVAQLEKQHIGMSSIINAQESRITDRMRELDQLTAIEADVGFRGPCTIILSGVYRGRGYVKFYEMDLEEFRHLVERYKFEERDNLIRHVDVPYHLNAAFDL